MKTLMNLFKSAEKVPSFSWRSMFEHAGLLKGLLLRVPLVISSSLSTEVGLAVVYFVRKVYRLKQKGLTTALYLKQCKVSLQRYYADSYDRRLALSVPVSLTRSGLPRIIPSIIRRKIMKRDENADRLVKLYLSWFSVSKIIALAPRLSRATLSSIITPTRDVDSLKGVMSKVRESYSILSERYWPWISTIPLYKGMTWEPTWKSTPMVEGRLRQKGQPGGPKTVILPILLFFEQSLGSYQVPMSFTKGKETFQLYTMTF